MFFRFVAVFFRGECNEENDDCDGVLAKVQFEKGKSFKAPFSIGFPFSWKQWTMSLMRLESYWCPLLMRRSLRNMVRILENAIIELVNNCKTCIRNMHMDAHEDT